MPHSEELSDLNGLNFARCEVTTVLMCRVQVLRVVIDCRRFEGGGGGTAFIFEGRRALTLEVPPKRSELRYYLIQKQEPPPESNLRTQEYHPETLFTPVFSPLVGSVACFWHVRNVSFAHIC